MSDDKANKLMAEATESLSSWSFFTPKEEKRAKARNMFLQAANMYKASANFNAAATAYMKAYDLSVENKSDIDMADDMTSVLQMQMKCDNFEASKAAVSKVVDMYMKSNKSSSAAKICQSFGEWRPSTGQFDDEQKREQDTYLEKAMTLFRTEGSRSTANDLRKSMAERKALNGDYEQAAREYEAIGKECLDDQLLRATAQRHFFMTLLCHVAALKPGQMMDQIDRLRSKFESISDLDTQFNQYTQEYILVQGIIEALENEDVEKYEDAQEKYAEICAVDTLKARLLLLGKQALRGAAEGNTR